MIGFTIIMVVLIICTTILIGVYMCYCDENGVKMFADPRYDKRISELEKTVKELKRDK